MNKERKEKDMKTYNIDVVKIDDRWLVFDFSITRPLIKSIGKKEDAELFATGYKMGIEIDSSLKFQPTIVVYEAKETNTKDFIENRKKYYDSIWKNEK